MYRLNSEWDIGEYGLIFSTKEIGHQWLLANSTVAEIAEQDGLSVHEFVADCYADGYFSWQTLQVIE